MGYAERSMMNRLIAKVMHDCNAPAIRFYRRVLFTRDSIFPGLLHDGRSSSSADAFSRREHCRVNESSVIG